MPQIIEQFDPSQILTPAQYPGRALLDAYGIAPSLTIFRGTVLGKLTATNLLTPYTHGASDGSQTPVAISQYSFLTDASSLIYYGPTAAPSYRASAFSTTPCFISGIFDPYTLNIGTPAGEKDTYTIASTIVIGDVFTLTLTKPNLETVVVNYTATAGTIANVTAGLAAAWNASADASYWAAATSTGTTVVLLATPLGQPFTVAGTTTSSAGTISRAVTTAASRSLTNLIADWPGARTLGNGFLYLP